MYFSFTFNFRLLLLPLLGLTMSLSMCESVLQSKEVSFLNITAFRDMVLADQPMLEVFLALKTFAADGFTFEVTKCQNNCKRNLSSLGNLFQSELVPERC